MEPAASAAAPESSAAAVSSSAPATTTPITYCVDQAQQDAGGVTIKTSAGVEFPALILGSGDRGIVLANMGTNDLCDWIAYAPELATAGYSVALFNYSGNKDFEDVLAVAATLRERGAKKVSLAGASVGATSVLQAAAVLDPAPAAVVSMSPQESTETDAAIKAVTMPTLFVAGEADGGFIADTKALHAAAPAKDKVLKLFPDNSHGTALLLDAAMKADIYAFIDKHTK